MSSLNRARSFYARHENADDILADAGQHGVVGLALCLGRVVLRLHEVVVLGRHHDVVDAHGLALVVILDGHLALGVGAQIGHLLAFLADLCQGAHDEVCQVERGGHIVLCLVAGIAEHHALVAGALQLLVFTRHTAVDVAALLVDGGEDAARVIVELIFGLGVADVLDGTAGHGLQVDVGARTHLAHDDHLSGGGKALDGAVRLVVVGQELVEQRVADLVAHFVGMTL